MIPTLIPIFMGILNMVASKTEFIDFSDININSGTRDHHKKMFFPSRNFDSDDNNFEELMALPGRHRKINLEDENDQVEDWDVEESEMLDDLTPRKIVTFGDIDDTSSVDLDQESRSIEELDENNLNHLANFLMKLLRQPTWEAPLVIVGEPKVSEESEDPGYETSEELETRSPMGKRSRYYGRYPFKRPHARARHSYDFDTARLCEPSRKEIFHLLVALHDVRNSKGRRAVNFCERHRSANAVFTSIRFLGRRKNHQS